MPLYEFYCSDCAKTAELLVQSFDSQGIICPHCGGTKMERRFSSSYMIKTGGSAQPKGAATCCGREERCETPPCSTGESCHRK